MPPSSEFRAVLHLGSPLVWLPLAAAMLFALGAILLRRAAAGRIDSWRVTFLSNQLTTLVFLPLLMLGGEPLRLENSWQPLMVAVLFIAGQMTTVLALTHGEVSVAAPVMGLKIVLVAVFSFLLFQKPLPAEIWLACALATVGVALLNVSGSRSGGRAGFSALLAFAAAAAFGLFDVCVQAWSPNWGIGRFLPCVFGMSSLLSLGFIPFFKDRLLAIPMDARWWLLGGCGLIAAQSLCIVSTVAVWGHAAEANVIYSTRGVWSVIFVWFLGRLLGDIDPGMTGRTLGFRLAGAMLLLSAVTLLLMG
ncbi:MAG: EamA family transporter [Planctomycetota bacterium]